MIPRTFKKLKSLIDSSLELPGDFFLLSADCSDQCFFMLSCLGRDKLLYLDDSFTSLFGYSAEKLKEGGMDFWFSLIHPDDSEPISKKIIESHQLLATGGFNEKEPTPLVLTYRVKHASGQWLWIKDTKFLISFTEKIIDKVLGKFETILAPMLRETELKKKLEQEKSCTRLLEYAMVHQHDHRKRPLNAGTVDRVQQVAASQLTRREKEILQLIAAGLSTKLIADKCHISIHTVETHRRHLLEKLQVKNSMELIKVASKIFWL